MLQMEIVQKRKSYTSKYLQKRYEALKELTEGKFWICSGKAFQSLGATTLKALSP